MSSIGLSELCNVVRTKNAGPFFFAVDIMFKSQEVYEAVKQHGLLSREIVAAAYGVPIDDVVVFQTCDHIKSMKATIRRRKVAGSPGDSDVYAMNQEVPVLAIRLPVEKLGAGRGAVG